LTGPDPAGGVTSDDRRVRRVVFASFIGTTIEWYDFFLYGTAAALVFNKLFFPTLDPLAGTLSAYGTFAIGFIARPFGGAIFGHYGDKIGRKTMLVWSLVLMGVATAIIGLLPTYGQIGVWAPVLLVLTRFAQGLGVGGEWAGAVLMAVEHSGGQRRGYHGSWPQMGVPAGSLLSTGVFALVSTTLGEEAFLAWGWRVPFLLSVVLIAVGLFIRLRLLESPAFTRLKEEKREVHLPLLAVVREYPRELLLGFGMRLAQNALFYIYTVFVLSYGEKTLGYSRTTLLAGVAIASFVGLFTTPLWGHLSDRLGRRPVYLAGAVLSMLYTLPFFWLLGQGSAVMVWLAIVLGLNIGHDLMYGPAAAFFSELFGPHVRYTGASLVYQVSSVFSGGLAPLIATWLLARHGIGAVAGYLSALCAISAVATWLAPETHRAEL
jgi:metabolite-proton symporter